MGKSRICNFVMQLEKNNGNIIECGAMRLKEGIDHAIKQEDYSGNVYLWPQTSYGRKITGDADYIKIFPNKIVQKISIC